MERAITIENIVDIFYRTINMEQLTDSSPLTDFVNSIPKDPDKRKFLQQLYNLITDKFRYEKGREIGEFKSPQRFLIDEEGDATDYAIFWGVLLTHFNIKYKLKVVSFHDSNVYSHIYPVAELEGEQIVLDSIYGRFNEEHPEITAEKIIHNKKG